MFKPTRSQFRKAAFSTSALVFALTASSSLSVAQAASSAPSLARPAAANSLQWDVVSVHPSDPNGCTHGAGMSAERDSLHIFCVPLQFTIGQAYAIPEPSRIVGAPDWAKNSKYDIDAKVAGEDVDAYGKLTREERSRMLQSVLADRFHLKAHIEQREMPVYELVLAKGGSKLKEATPEDANRGHMTTDGRGKIDAAAVTLTGLPFLLNNEVGRTVVDKTGLTGKYTFTLDYVPASKASTDETGGPSIFTALEEQLGLKLQPGKAPLDVLVIDSMEQPAAN